jgi:phage shock protein A
VFGFFKRKQRQPAVADPLAEYDGQVEALERDAAELRRAAATLLAHTSTLERDCTRQESERGELSARLDEATRAGDARAVKLLSADVNRVDEALRQSREALAQAEVEAQLLVDTARDMSAEVTRLRAERGAAKARLAAGRAAGQAFRTESARAQRTVALERARDEVERAHALAELWREERGKR